MIREEAICVGLRDRLVVAVLCGVSWLPIAFVRRGYTWDDWVLAGISPNEVRDWHRDAGRVFPLSSEVFLVGGSIGVRLGTVVALIVTGLAVLSLLSRYGVFNRSELILVSVLAAVNPLDTSKSLLVTAPYTWSLAFFFLGWALLVSHRWWVVGLPVLFVSYDTNSLLFFAVLPLLDLIYLATLRRYPATRLRISGLGASLVLYAVSRFLIRPPQGSYEGYNSPGVFGLIFTFASFFGIALLALGLLRGRPLPSELSSRGSLLAAVGVLLILVGIVPYLAVQRFPPYLTAETRHYLLVGLGVGVTVAGIARAFGSLTGMPSMRRGVVRSVAILSILFTWLNSFLSLQYWNFVDEVSRSLPSIEIPPNSLVLVEYDETPVVALTRRIGPNYLDTWYVWTGIVDPERVNGVLAIVATEYTRYLQGRFRVVYGEQREAWGVVGFQPSTTATYLRIRNVGGILGFFSSYELYKAEIKVDLPLS